MHFQVKNILKSNYNHIFTLFKKNIEQQKPE
jgi:hypothetical protein